MATTVISIKTDPKVKKQAQKVASELGLSLSSIINGFLKQFIRNKAVLFTLNESEPSAFLLSSIEEAKKERKRGDCYSFNRNKETFESLKETLEVEKCFPDLEKDINDLEKDIKSGKYKEYSTLEDIKKIQFKAKDKKFKQKS